jgi:predicted esterase YcpF (UPF0227 family)
VSAPALVYLHGFRSSPRSAKAIQLGAAVAALPAAIRPKLIVPALPDRPARAMETIDAVAAGCDQSQLCFIGSSLGGFYATVAAERLGTRAVLINPAVCPDEELRPHAGVQTNLHTGAAFEVTDAHFAELRAMRLARITRPERYWLFVETGDEVLDYREAVAYYAGALQEVVRGGDHSLVTFPERIPDIVEWAAS